MRTIKYTNRFKQDYKRVRKSGRYGNKLDKDFMTIVKLLASDKSLLKRHCDHPLIGDWKDHRDCHIKPDFNLQKTRKKSIRVSSFRFS